MDALLHVVQTINSYLSDYVLIVLLIGTGLFFSIRTRFVQVRCFGEGVRRMFSGFSFKGKKHESGMSSFQALATAVAAQVGTGNIVGACGAILVGGPGAIFWMWLIAFFGMATNYAEAVLAQTTRVVDADGTVHGGPVYYIKQAFKGGFGTFLAGFFGVAIILALGFMGCMVQSNSIASTCNTAFGIPLWVMGGLVVVAAGFVFFGSTSRIASVTEKVVPVMALIYLVGGLIVLVANAGRVPEAFSLIFQCAFNPQAGIGGVTFGIIAAISQGAKRGLFSNEAGMGRVPEAFSLIFQCAFNPQAGIGGVTFGIIAAISQGAKRGLFSNEAGMGSTPHAHALANVKNPHEQGTVAMLGVFIDTFVVVTITALVVITMLYTGDGALAQGAYDGIDKTNMAQLAFSSVMGEGLGGAFVAVCLLFFAFSTILSWNLFAKINVERLFGKKAVPVFCVIALALIFTGSLLSNDLVWELADMFNQLMVLPNVLALVALSGVVVSCVNTYGGKGDPEPEAVEELEAGRGALAE